MSAAAYQFGYDRHRRHLILEVSPEANAEIHSGRQMRLWLNQYSKGLGLFAPPLRRRWGFGHSLIPSKRMVTDGGTAFACPIPTVMNRLRSRKDLALQRRLATLSTVLKLLNCFNVGEDQQMTVSLTPSKRRAGFWDLQGTLYPSFLLSLRQHMFEVSWKNIRDDVVGAEHHMIRSIPPDEFRVEYFPNHRFILGYLYSRIEIDPDLTYETRVRQFKITSDDPIRVMMLLAGLGATADALRRRSVRHVA